MTAFDLLVPNTSNIFDFNNLALFICHLFIAGNFRSGNILYDPNVFDGQLTTQIDSICSHQIPWLTIDISQPSSIPWQPNERTDHILQLIFFDPKHLAERIVDFKEYFIFYRIFVFPSKESEFRMYPIHNLIALSLYYNLNDGSIYLDNGENTERNGNIISGRGKESDINLVNIFDRTFAEYERIQPLTISMFSLTHKDEGRTSYVSKRGYLYIANIFYSTLNATYIKINSIPIGGKELIHSNQKVIPKYRNHRKKLSLEYENVEKQITPKSIHQSTLQLDTIFMASKADRYANTYALYPYHSIDIVVIFIYGQDFNRKIDILYVAKSFRAGFGLGVLTIGLMAIILHVGRRRLRLQHDGFISTLSDSLVTFIGGGNLRMRHRFERWFFGIAMAAAFFMISLFSGDLLDNIYSILYQKINTFEELAQIKSPIYLHPSLGQNNGEIKEMFRRKMRRNVHFGTTNPLEYLLIHQNNCFVYVFDKLWIDRVQATPKKFNRDGDVLQGLGSIYSRFYLETDRYMPKRSLEKIDRTTSSIMASGLHKFYESISIYKMKLITRDYFNSEEEDVNTLTIQKLQKLLLIIVCYWGVSVVAFIAEIIISKWINLYNRAMNALRARIFT